jgi:AcrR family transcriptional regulator
MAARSATRKRSAGRRAVRFGRPSRALAGEVEARILDAAGRVFLEHGFEGASVDEIAEVARAGKTTIYARFPGKEALFAAVMARKASENPVSWSVATTGATVEERLAGVATAILRNILADETVGLARLAVAEARRFPELAVGIHRTGRERGAEAVSGLLSELAETGELRALPAVAADRLAATAGQFLDLIVPPMLVRALFGEDLAALRAEIGPHVARAVAFFLAAYRLGVALQLAPAADLPTPSCHDGR